MSRIITELYNSSIEDLNNIKYLNKLFDLVDIYNKQVDCDLDLFMKYIYSNGIKLTKRILNSLNVLYPHYLRFIPDIHIEEYNDVHSEPIYHRYIYGILIRNQLSEIQNELLDILILNNKLDIITIGTDVYFINTDLVSGINKIKYSEEVISTFLLYDYYKYKFLLPLLYNDVNKKYNIIYIFDCITTIINNRYKRFDDGDNNLILTSTKIINNFIQLVNDNKQHILPDDIIKTFSLRQQIESSKRYYIDFFYSEVLKDIDSNTLENLISQFIEYKQGVFIQYIPFSSLGINIYNIPQINNITHRKLNRLVLYDPNIVYSLSDEHIDMITSSAWLLIINASDEKYIKFIAGIHNKLNKRKLTIIVNKLPLIKLEIINEINENI